MDDEEEIVFAPSPWVSRRSHPGSPSETLSEILNEEEAGAGHTRSQKALQVPLKKQARGSGITRVPAKRRARHLYGLDTNEKDIKTDFTDFGFEPKRLNELLKKKDVPDLYVGLPKGKNLPSIVVDESDESTGQRLSRGKGRATAVLHYESLWITEGTNWVLFDPLRGYPVGITRPPLIFRQFETYKPGNARIIEYNTESGCLRVRTTPRTLEGREVIYTKTGPRLVDLEKMRKPKRGRYKSTRKGVQDQEPKLHAITSANEDQSDGLVYNESSDDEHNY